MDAIRFELFYLSSNGNKLEILTKEKIGLGFYDRLAPCLKFCCVISSNVIKYIINLRSHEANRQNCCSCLSMGHSKVVALSYEQVYDCLDRTT